MAIQTEPTRIQIPFADSGTKNTIPATNSTPSASQAASWMDGFPTQCSLPLASGGIPPARADFNGIFNTMSQSIRFTQEGGVWAWDATVDYAANRMVLGSDGLLYWSIAQSGPNLGGAQDPTADNGTYWKSPYAKTMGMGEDSGAVATTKWVRDFTTAHEFYVDGTNGNDASDGLTQATAFKTIAKALSLIDEHNGRLKIYVAADAYTENIDIPPHGEVEIELQGNVSTTGRIYVQSGFLQVTGNYTLTTGSFIYLLSGSYAIFYCNVSATASARSTIDIEDSSYCDFRGTCAATQTGASSGVNVVNASGVIFNSSTTITGNTGSGEPGISCSRNSAIRAIGAITITGSGFSSGIYIGMGSSFYSTSDLTIAEGSNTSYALTAQNNSAIILNSGTSIIHGGIYNPPVYIFNNSTLSLQNSASLTIWHHTSGVRSMYLWNSACFNMSGTATLAFRFESGKTATYIIDVTTSFFDCAGTFTIDFGTGTATSATLECTMNGIMNIPTGGTVTGTITGKRYLADYGGQIWVHGAGANRIPGTTAGEAKAASYGYYA